MRMGVILSMTFAYIFEHKLQRKGEIPVKNKDSKDKITAILKLISRLRRHEQREKGAIR